MVVGQKLKINKFSFNNKAGGTAMSDGFIGDEKFDKPIEVIVVKSWHDYETGNRGWAMPIPGQPELEAYLERNAKRGWNDLFYNPQNYTEEDADEATFGNRDKFWLDDGKTYIVYISEFNIIV